MAKKILILPGDGIGPEVSRAMVRVVDAVTGGTIEWEEQLAGSAAVDAGHSPLPAASMFPWVDMLPVNDGGSGLGSLNQDDIASASRYHPEPGFATAFGRIRGTVALDGDTADAVHVVAVDADTLEPVVSLEPAAARPPADQPSDGAEQASAGLSCPTNPVLARPPWVPQGTPSPAPWGR